MDTLQPVGATRENQAAKRPFRLREIPDTEGLDLRAALAEASGLGFDAALLPTPFETRDGLLADGSRAAAVFGGGTIEEGLATLARARAGTPIALIADLPVDGVAAHSPLHRANRSAFAEPDTSGLFDPRRVLEPERAPPQGEAGAASLAGLVADLAEALARAGLDGVRLRRLARADGATVHAIARAVRERLPGFIVIADTAGLPWDQLERIPAGLLDHVVASSAWWNWADDWFFSELDHLRRIAPVLVPAVSLARQSGTVSSQAGLTRDLGLALSLGSGWILPAATIATDDTVRRLLRETNALFDGPAAAALASGAGVALLNGIHAPVLASLRTAEPDPRGARMAFLALLNTSARSEATIDPAQFLPSVGGLFGPFTATHPGEGERLVPGHGITLAAGAFRLFQAERAERSTSPAPLDPEAARQAAATMPRLALENPTPAVDGGQFAVKRRAGETVTVEIDIIGDGHDKLGAALQWRGPGDPDWSETRLAPLGNDRWQAAFPIAIVGMHHYRVVAWRDAFATFRDELAKKHNAGVPTALEIREGTALVVEQLGGSAEPGARSLVGRLEAADDDDARRAILLDDALNAAMMRADPRPHAVSTAPMPVDAERTGAAFASWYEVFPRSLSDDVGRHGTFRDVERHLPRIRDMGFDVLYFPPIHPIGRTNRKGPNNTLTPSATDPGSPYAIGSDDGGHDALHPELGSFNDFEHLLGAAASHGLEIAIDFAIQCSPDHPWLTEHKDWFVSRPDGTIRYAENPPKKYQDIVNVDFYAAGSVPGLWLELAQVVMFWCERGIRLFRVDNPHTKPFPFWQWMIGEIRQRYPDAVFLAEAFTRPKVMARLAKVGFSQSYTYFTWRNDKAELAAYLEELADGPLREFFRPHFFVNTPDINPFFLQDSGRPGFLIRAALAATLSGLWGVYNGFELCEGTPLAPGKEEYLDSEKFQLRAWDWNRSGNIVPEITRLNAIRRANPALQTHLGVKFLPSSSDAVLVYEKATTDRSNVLLIAVSLDPLQAHESAIELPLWRSGLPDHGTLQFEDLLDDRRFALAGKQQTLRLAPERPYSIWRLAAPLSS